MTVQKNLTAGLILVLGLSFAGASAFAQGHDDVFANTTAQWWQLIGSIPTTVNPLLDSTGADCMVGQRGPVWFLAGTSSGGTASRTCSIPAGEALFFPVVNFVNINTPNVCGQNSSNLSAAVLRSQIAPFIDAATNLSVQLDGYPVPFSRVKSTVFAISFPADNIFNAPCGGAGTVPAGTYSPAVDDGFYAVLPPLRVGSHTLHIHGEIPSLSFILDVTYDLTTVPVQLK